MGLGKVPALDAHGTSTLKAHHPDRVDSWQGSLPRRDK
jgi:hypothetical protein